MENKYWEKSLEFQEEITSYISEILRVYGNELLLRIEELNLLSAKNNCISSSTAIGYCVEEFLVSKLETYTNSTPKTKFRIQRDNTSTQNKSYDCYSEQGNDLYLVNLKVNKKNNNAVAAIDRLYKDYVEFNGEIQKHFLIFKLHYEVGQGKITNQQKILIKKLHSFFLEEIDFSFGHKQDSRNWSREFNPNSGRLQITDTILKNNHLDAKEISYEKTWHFINDIFLSNLGKKND